jgi:D-alanyl-D-alanine carboxypeptidase
LLPPQNSYSYKVLTEEYHTQTPLVLPSPQPYPLKRTEVSAPALTASGSAVIDIRSGVFLYEKNADQRLLPASTSKIMTALVAIESYPLDELVTIHTTETQKNLMGLVQGEKISVQNLLYGLLVYSANDAALALAAHYPYGQEAFIARMNARAGELHLQNTHFVNPIGFDDPNQYTSAKDLARLSLFALKNKELEKIVGTQQITVSDSTYTYFHPLRNVNQLLGKIPGVSGIKTGFTEGAGECLVSTAQRGDQKILIVVLKSSDRFGETEQLIDWTFANHEWRTFTPPS